jgi:hypothetical protein
MADNSPAQAINQVNQIEKLCDFLENPTIKAAVEGAVPVSMPPEQGSLGFDTPLWVGLGIVGLWAALDAFAERTGLQSDCPTCGGKSCIRARFDSALQGNERERLSLAELEDLRHLYAHNYAGEADDEYFQTKPGRERKRHILKRGVSVKLSCGAIFDGSRLSRQNTPYSPRSNPQYALSLSDLRMYCGKARSVLERFL